MGSFYGLSEEDIKKERLKENPQPRKFINPKLLYDLCLSMQKFWEKKPLIWITPKSKDGIILRVDREGWSFFLSFAHCFSNSYSNRIAKVYFIFF